MPNSLWPHGLQHARVPCPSTTRRVYSNSCSLSRWCHLTISSSVVHFSSAFNLSQHQGLFKWVSSLHQMAKVLEFQLQHQSFQWIFRTDFLKMDSLDLLAVQGTLNSLIQNHSSTASILWCSAFFMFQFSHPYMTTGKGIALTRQTFIGKIMSLLFNMRPRLVIAFLPRSKHLLISWPQSPSAVILEPPKIKSLNSFHCFPIYLPWSDGTWCHHLSFLNWVLSQLFHSPLSLSRRGSLVLLRFLP